MRSIETHFLSYKPNKELASHYAGPVLRFLNVLNARSV